jgi:hypothetical protein
MYCADADQTLCQLCYETWADEHAEELDTKVPKKKPLDAHRLQLLLAVALESSLTTDLNGLLIIFN